MKVIVSLNSVLVVKPVWWKNVQTYCILRDDM